MTMRHFRLVSGDVSGYDDATQSDFIHTVLASGATELTNEQFEAYRNPSPSLADLKVALVAGVDVLIAGIYARWLRFEAEYREREAAARAYVDAGASGDPGIWVTSFSLPTGMPNEQAAALIIAQADALRDALVALGALRMRKYEITAASTAAIAQQKHHEIIATAEAIADGLQ